MEKKFPVPKEIKEFAQVFIDNGYCLYIVGGAVRDYLLSRKNSDYDFCTNARPEDVKKLFPHVIPTGIKHGTVTVLFHNQSYEVTTFRSEAKYSDHRHPDQVQFVSNLQEDLSRRDFTVNAFAAHCVTGEIVDLFNGFQDLNNKIIRAIGEGETRFTEDALRLMRLARFCSKLSFLPDFQTLKDAKKCAPLIVHISKERIMDELNKILMTDKPSVGLSILEITGILNYILPEVAVLREIDQYKVGANDVLQHVYNAIDIAASFGYGLNVRLSLLLHDIGKKPTFVIREDGKYTFYGHDVVGSTMARTILKNLKCSNETIDIVTNLIGNHMTKYKDNWSDGAVKRFVNRVGKDNISQLFEVLWCDAIASVGRANLEETDRLLLRIKTLEMDPMTVKDLAINGKDLQEAGIKPSPKMGKILQDLLEKVLDDPSLNNKETLLSLIKT
ncbi:MAG: HD domain-containing protein [Sphaerochaetaceae bacterium]|nr:HD domain-containing protein [Sphaerochaetaceae bacterium]